MRWWIPVLCAFACTPAACNDDSADTRPDDGGTDLADTGHDTPPAEDGAAPDAEDDSGTADVTDDSSTADVAPGDPLPDDAQIIYLHHSTGEVIWEGGVAAAVAAYDDANGTSYAITERAFPSGDPYPWENYPYDYWNIWVGHAGPDPYLTEPTLEILTAQYAVIMFKHCFPVSGIEPDGTPDIASEDKTLANYKLQYNALKAKLRSFPNVRFVVWTGAALLSAETSPEQADRAKQFFDWVKSTWDEKGDNIYVWDFFGLETDGGKYLLKAHGSGDSHPNEAFAAEVAPFFGQRLIDVIGGTGDTASIAGSAR